MRRVDLLRMQLLNSRGRFFTAEFLLNMAGPRRVRANVRVNEIVSISREYVVANVGYWSRENGYVPSLNVHFPVDKQGDCTYLACDKSKFNMEGWVSS